MVVAVEARCGHREWLPVRSTLSARWSPHYAADIITALWHINNFLFVSTIKLDEAGNEVPLALYVERPPDTGQNPNRLIRGLTL